jgi:glutamate dehydrogenase/leucine dehydrogenase
MVTQEACRAFGLEFAGARCVVQGFGNVGSHAARLLREERAVVLAVSDVTGGIYSEHGLDVADVLRHLQEKGTVAGYSEAQPITNAELLELPCDILIPAALDHAIDAGNARRVQAKMVVEAANAPVTAGADVLLHQNGVCVVPDILANAGGVTVSYFEWAQNTQQFSWKAERVTAELHDVMTRAFADVWEASCRHGVNLREAAYLLALERVAEASRLRWLE